MGYIGKECKHWVALRRMHHGMLYNTKAEWQKLSVECNVLLLYEDLFVRRKLIISKNAHEEAATTFALSTFTASNASLFAFNAAKFLPIAAAVNSLPLTIGYFFNGP